jgi:hypothetical protein
MIGGSKAAMCCVSLHDASKSSFFEENEFLNESSSKELSLKVIALEELCELGSSFVPLRACAALHEINH